MVAKEKLDSLLAQLQSYVAALKALASVPREEFLGNADKIGNAKYHFVIAIECCIDIANHIIASERFRVPRDNADTFVVLVEKGVCPTDLESPLRAMARFRNRLVHLYWDVDDELLARYLQESATALPGR
ncbi:MAG: DUF86 domain-containing protein [Planctomycetota bacterium]|nr:DUF86 domain-containing protein [Planctomycetota bacterium]